MRIAIPVCGNNISPVLDTATTLLILDTGKIRSKSRKRTFLTERNISKRYFRIKRLDIDTLICAAVSRSLANLLEASGIKLIQGISGIVEDILTDYSSGKLTQPKYLIPHSKKLYGGLEEKQGTNLK